jgi:hypothetical protein
MAHRYFNSATHIAIDVIVAVIAWVRAMYCLLLGAATVVGGHPRGPLHAAFASRRYAPAAVHLLAADPPRQLRVLSHFWHDYCEPTREALAAAAARWGVPPVFRVRGAVLGAGHDAPAVAFRLTIDLAAGTFALAHTVARPGGSPGGSPGGPAPPADHGECVHPARPLTMGGAAVSDVLGDIIGRRACARAPAPTGRRKIF